MKVSESASSIWRAFRRHLVWWIERNAAILLLATFDDRSLLYLFQKTEASYVSPVLLSAVISWVLPLVPPAIRRGYLFVRHDRFFQSQPFRRFIQKSEMLLCVGSRRTYTISHIPTQYTRNAWILSFFENMENDDAVMAVTVRCKPKKPFIKENLKLIVES